MQGVAFLVVQIQGEIVDVLRAEIQGRAFPHTSLEEASKRLDDEGVLVGPVLAVWHPARDARAIVKCCGRRLSQAASVCSAPSTTRTPAMTLASSVDPFSNRQLFAADSISLNTIARQADRLPLPFVLVVRSRTVANVDSIGLVVRRCTHCSAGKS